MNPVHRLKRMRGAELALALALALIVLGAGPAGAGFNEDGNLDAIFANSKELATAPPSPNRVCLGDGDGGFECSDVSPNGNRSFGVAVGDIDGDGHLDAVFANRAQRDLVCLGDGAGGFDCGDVSSDIRNNDGVALGDVNNDGHLDAVFANTFEGSNQVCLGDGSGSLENCSDISSDNESSVDVALGDVDGDGNLDAVFASTSNGQSDQVCLGDGLGRFECSDANPDRDFSFGVALGYVNADGDLDAVFANSPYIDQNRNRVCLGDGDGGFECSDVSSDGGEDVALGDVDGDGNLDAVFANVGQRNRVCLGDGDGGFECSDVNSDIIRGVGVALGDVDGDGNLDAVFANLFQRNRVCLGDGDGGFGGFGPAGDECGDVSPDTIRNFGVALTDTDLDGVQDNEDKCIPSDIRQTVWICGKNSRVDNELTDTSVPPLFDSTLGCTVTDLVRETAKLSADRADFRRNLKVVLDELIGQQILTRSSSKLNRAVSCWRDLRPSLRRGCAAARITPAPPTNADGATMWDRDRCSGGR